MPRTNDHSIDKAIGQNLKMYRKREHVSQAALGKHLGVTFQQVQKYENGTNRVSAATLIKIARFLNVSVGELMALDRRQPEGDREHIARFARTREAKTLIQGFLAIPNPILRRYIIGLVGAAGR